jgi:hypothetical protein
MKKVLSFIVVLALLSVSPAFSAAAAVSATDCFEAQISAAREEFFSGSAVEALDVIEIDSSRIIHLPQEFEQPELPSLFAPASARLPTYAGPFDVGDTRDFRARTGAQGSANEWRVVSADLRGQGEHTNIWVVDCRLLHGAVCIRATCHQKDITPALAQEIANQVDVIYKRMTGDGGFGTHANMQINTGYINMPLLGDMGNDGKVNYLLYDIFGDGGSSGSSYTAGFFLSSDFFTHSGGEFRNGLDMLHIDIGNGQGFNAFRPGASGEDRLEIYNTLAHELQHLLFYINFGIYIPASLSWDFMWLNEALSELAGTFYVQEGAEIADFGRLRRAAQNRYANSETSPPSEYGDFLNFNGSFKNYGMGLMFGMLMYKTYGGSFVTGIYDSFNAAYPPAKNRGQYLINESLIAAAGHDRAAGRALRGGTGVGTAANFSDTLPLLYYLFMENFAADGGMVYSAAPSQSTKFYGRSRPQDNLWAVRSVAGVNNGRVFTETVGVGSSISASGFEQYPVLMPGGLISLRGYGSQPGFKSATHEMLYELTFSANNPVLNITAPNDGNSASRYYVVIPKDTLVTGTFTAATGHQGADVYPLEKGALTRINTHGRQAYLFVVTFNQNIQTAMPPYSWSAAAASDIGGTVTLSEAAPRLGQTITASLSPAGAYSFRWLSGGMPVGTNSDTYTVTQNDIGKIIRVEVTAVGRSGTLTAQTVAAARAAGPPRPGAATAFAVSGSRIVLNETAGLEYSNGGLFWQDSSEFTNLLPHTSYTFFQRVKATATAEASAVSSAFVRTTTNTAALNFFAGNGGQLVRAFGFDGDGVITLTNSIEHPDSIVIKDRNLTLALGSNNLTVPALIVDGGSLTTSGTGAVSGGITGARGGVVNGIPWFTVDYSGNGGTGAVPGETHFPQSTAVTVASPSSLARTGYAFDSWNTGANGNGIPYQAGDMFPLMRNTTLYAQWQCLHITASAADCTKCDGCGAANGRSHSVNIALNCTVCVTCNTFGIAQTCGNTCVFCTCNHASTTAAYTLTPTCLTGGIRRTVCDNCANVVTVESVGALGHELPTAWTTRVAATTTAEGLRFRRCQRSGCMFEVVEAIPRLPGSSSSSGGGGSGGGGSGDTAPVVSTAPSSTVLSGTGSMIAGFAIPRAAINAASGSLPVFQLRAVAGGAHTITTDASQAGQNAILVRMNPTTGELEVVNSAVVSPNGNARINITRDGDYIVLIRKTGDVTGTGDVGTADALALLRHIAGVAALNEIELFSANGRLGDTGTTDALNILRYVAGVINNI